MDIMEKVTRMTDGRVSVGPGTLYNLLENFLEAGTDPGDESRGPQAKLCDNGGREEGAVGRAAAAFDPDIGL